MSIGQRGLGRGLDALFENTTSPAAQRSPDVTSLLLDAISPNPDQPRKTFDQQALQELADSIASQGLIQPILVRPARGTANTPGQPAQSSTGQYEIVAGERRWRAARLAGLHKIPVYVRSLSDEDVMAAALIENLQREDLNPVEEALALQTLRDQFALTQEEMSKRLGKSRSTIANALRLLQLSEEAQDDVRQGRLNAGHARALLSITSQQRQEVLRAAIVAQNLTVRDAELAVLAWKAGRPFAWEIPTAPQHHSVTADNAPHNSDSPLASFPNPEHAAGNTGETDNTVNVSGETTKNQANNQTDNIYATSEDATASTEAHGQAGLNSPNAEIDLAPKASVSSRIKSAHIKHLQSTLTHELALHTRISGTEEKGKITLSYQSPAELNALLQRLGIAAAQDAQDTAAN